MRPPSRSRRHPPLAAPTRSSHSSSRAKGVHSATPILPSCNYCGNPAHKASECNLPSEDLLCDYCGKEGHHEGSWEGPPRSFYGLHDAMVGEYVLSSAHNSSLTPELTTSFYPSYFVAQEANVAPRVSATRQVIQTDGLASGSSPNTRARGARVVMPQSFRPLNTKEKRTLLARGEETTTPQVARASNSRVAGIHLSIKDIIAVLEDTLNTTSGPLPIPNPHATEVLSNTLERHSIGSRVADGVRAQPMILGVQFAKKMGMLDSKLRKSMWQIRIASGSIEEVLGESSDFIALNFNEGTDQELCLQVRCLVTNATSYDVLIGQEALFPPGFTTDNWFEHAYYRVD
ncbi:unnamed protein product [Sphagnum compactum]